VRIFSVQRGEDEVGHGERLAQKVRFSPRQALTNHTASCL
jgi:hypothetical protein